jgi:2-polyprenyl-6-methoxyphenol hydroxylase-like FAD-dependent oxidoreductase
MAQRALIVGGSIGGLAAAALLDRVGWEVEVFERVDVELSGRGAGIVTHPPLIEALKVAGAETSDLGVISEYRVGFDRQGTEIARFAFPQLVTSWDCLQARLRARVPAARYHLGHVLQSFTSEGGRVQASFANGHTAEGDVLIGADGFRSTVRQHIFPEVQPAYAGYVVWRGLVHEADLPVAARDQVFDHFGFHLPAGDGEVIGYPIAGPGNDLRPGHRRYNFVWYRVADPARLRDMLTDEAGVTHDLSIPPPLIRGDVLAGLKADARAKLPTNLAAMLDHAHSLFFTPIYDLASPAMTAPCVAMVGDAAFLARPHIGAGVTKACEDAVALARCLSGGVPAAEGLRAYEGARLAANRKAWARSRYMGEYLMPQYRDAAGKADWVAHHNLQTIMRDTAVLNFA